MLQEILDRIQSLPLRKTINPKTHAVLDYLTTSAFLLMGSYFWGRNRRAAATALTNGFMVLGLSLLTDYDGDGRRPIDFQTHGQMDIVQAVLAGGMPAVLGFGDETAALPFRLQALNEFMVVGLTDFRRPAGLGRMRRVA
jgi:hypothetical protein